MKYASKSVLSALALVAVGGGIGAYAYFGTYIGGIREAELKDEEKYLFHFPPVKVVAGDLESETGTKVRFAKLASGWAILEPVEAPGDKKAIEAFVAAVANTKTESTVQAPKEDRAKYGLKDPRLAITLEVSGEPKAQLFVGAENPFDHRIYVENPALDSYGLTEKSFFGAVNKDLFALREKRLWSFDDKSVRVLEVLKDERLLYRIERTKRGFDIVEPIKHTADIIEVVGTLEKLRELRARKFADDSGTGDPLFLAKFGLDPPAYRVRLELENDRQLVLRMGSARNEINFAEWFARVEGTKSIVQIFETFYKDIDRPITEFQNRALLDLDREEIARVSIKSADLAIELERGQGDAWELVAPKKARAADFKVSALVYALATLRSKKIDTTSPGPKDRARAGLEPANVTVTFGGKDKKPLAVLWIGKEVPASPTDRYAMVKGGIEIGIVENAKITLPKSADELVATSTSAP